MAKKKDVSIVRRPWGGKPRPLPLKFHPRALVPSQLTLGDTGPWEYLCEGGERARFEYRGTLDNSGGARAEELDAVSQELYKMPFAAIEAVWFRRVGRLDGWWNIVRMVRLDVLESK